MTTSKAENDWDMVPACPRCGGDCCWQECGQYGCDDGGIDRYDEDPLWYDGLPADARFEDCDMCEGKGGWWRCCNSYEWCQANPLPGHEAVSRAA